MMQTVIGGPVLPHPQKIARLWFPQYEEHTTPIHQDFIHIQGTHNVWTAWMPLGDIPRELGGLAVMPRSHKLGVLSVTYVSDPVSGATTTVNRNLCGEGVRTGARVLVRAGGVPLASVKKIHLQRIVGNRPESTDNVNNSRLPVRATCFSRKGTTLGPSRTASATKTPTLPRVTAKASRIGPSGAGAP